MGIFRCYPRRARRPEHAPADLRPTQPIPAGEAPASQKTDQPEVPRGGSSHFMADRSERVMADGSERGSRGGRWSRFPTDRRRSGIRGRERAIPGVPQGRGRQRVSGRFRVPHRRARRDARRGRDGGQAGPLLGTCISREIDPKPRVSGARRGRPGEHERALATGAGRSGRSRRSRSPPRLGGIGRQRADQTVTGKPARIASRRAPANTISAQWSRVAPIGS